MIVLRILAVLALLQDDSSLAKKPAWTKIESPCGDELQALSFVDSTTGYILSRNGWLLRTSDGGATWKVRRQGVRAKGSRGFEHVWFTDERTGWIVECEECGNGGPAFFREFKTEDGGERWTKAPPPLDIHDKLYYWRRFKVRTGESWVRTHDDHVSTSGPGRDATTIANFHPALKDFGKMFDTHYNDVSFADQDHGALAGRSLTGALLLLTEDAGRTWSRRTIPGVRAPSFSGVWMHHPREIRLAAGGTIWASRDGGLTWTVEWRGVAGEEIDELLFLERDFGFAIGKGGLILRYSAR
jgi:photosystem II stability/assembly factor-like uncharacterized protein